MAELDYYKVLGVSSSAGANLIRNRYQQLAKQYHPDHQGDERSMIIINRAYEVLSNSSRRTEYDHLRRLRHKKWTPASSTQQTVHNTWSRANQKAKTPNKDKIAVAIFLILFLITLLGFH